MSSAGNAASCEASCETYREAQIAHQKARKLAKEQRDEDLKQVEVEHAAYKLANPLPQYHSTIRWIHYRSILRSKITPVSNKAVKDMRDFDLPLREAKADRHAAKLARRNTQRVRNCILARNNCK